MSRRRTDGSFERAIRANREDLLRYLQRRLFDGADAGEAFGDLLLTAWNRRAKMPQDEHEARLWLFGVARNTLRSTRRSFIRRSAATRRLAESMRLLPQQLPEDPRARELAEAIAELPEEDAELVRLVYWDGLTSFEAGAVLGLNPSTTRSRLASARLRLRAILVAEPAHGP